MKFTDFTPAIMIKNEEYWIYYVLRDVLKIFGRAIVLDTGSTDRTLEILRSMKSSKPGLFLIEENYDNDARKIGNGRNVLMSHVNTEWMFLIDGDEIWRKQQLISLMNMEIPNNMRVCMILGRNIEDVNGNLLLRDGDTAHYDRLFRKGIAWHAIDYPFESYGLSATFPDEDVYYVKEDLGYFWHVRNASRSSLDNDAYFRDKKKDFYQWIDKPYTSLHQGWLHAEEIAPNPYIAVGRD